MSQQSMNPPDFVQRDGNRILVHGKLNPYTANGILGRVNEAKLKVYEDYPFLSASCGL
jgi:hypothetical protein